ncbi:ribonuclease HII [Fictibacillus barbaricus]|uniref:Ribonuclease HII n=1 Tax=Fictibacillus barbaricus TaxID=182136 RepID=A0ABU1U513_9BACL|nr:ribonuclease HII [Fictibacillus barbaricus]MDR7074547.1 ribonuclease HII [Fictibacillus barbaricus]
MKSSIKEWESALKSCQMDELPKLLKQLSEDERQGAKRLVEIHKKRINQYREEQERLKKISLFEKQCYQSGKKRVAGVDEVGRGPLAGPVVAAAVILPEGFTLEGINDSKKLSEKKRDTLYESIISNAVSYSVCLIEPLQIDEINIYQASKLAMTEAICKLYIEPDQLLIDAMEVPLPIDQMKIIKGDEKSISIAAASIVAKVTRDNYMKKLDEVYPHYGFKKNMGYGTKEHLEALRKFGATDVHRKSFNPVGDFIQITGSE